MGLEDYPRPSVAVDTAVLSVVEEQLCVSLVERDGGLRLPGTFLHEGELLADAVARSLKERTGLTDVRPTQLHVFDALDRDDRGRVLSVAHLLALPYERLGALAPVPIDSARGLAFDHDAIVDLAVRALRRDYAEHPDPHGLLPAEFTMLELLRLHSAVDPETAQKDTFRRAMLPKLRETDRVQEGSIGKPAKLFRRR